MEIRYIVYKGLLFFVLRQRPRTSLQCFALEHSLYKAKHCRDVLGRKTRYKIGPLDFECRCNKDKNRTFWSQCRSGGGGDDM